MQTLIDFLVNNYLWFIIISLILIFALIGYLVDTSERENKKKLFSDENLYNTEIAREVKEPVKTTEPLESLNMDMGTEEIQELNKDVIVMPKIKEGIVQEGVIPKETTEVLDIE